MQISAATLRYTACAASLAAPGNIGQSRRQSRRKSGSPFVINGCTTALTASVLPLELIVWQGGRLTSPRRQAGRLSVAALDSPPLAGLLLRLSQLRTGLEGPAAGVQKSRHQKALQAYDRQARSQLSGYVHKQCRGTLGGCERLQVCLVQATSSDRDSYHALLCRELSLWMSDGRKCL